MTARFRAMGCDVVVAGGDAAAVGRLFEAYEQLFSRFVTGSELNRVNASPEDVVLVSPPFARALKLALRVAAETDGLVDPTLGRAIVAAGYDRDFASLDADPRPPGPAAPGRWSDVRLDGQLLRRPRGVHLDLNGVVKSLAVDDAVALLDGDGFVSAGGDLAARGPVDVGLPGGGAIRLERGGLATSGSVGRRWLRGGVVRHHLLDPRTGRPSTSCWAQVTVAGGSCVAADVAAKTAFLLGTDGPAWLDARGVPGRFVARDGEIVESAAWSGSVAEGACI